MSERVVLLDAEGHAVGTAAKATVHHARTPRHLAFSAYLFDGDDALLVTRRALDKPTFPGLWTNSVCGHPGPREPLPAAVARRASEELGTAVTGLRLVLPRFQYVAAMDGIVENEWCPVYAGRVPDRSLSPAAEEVAGVEWVPWPRFAEEVLTGRRAVSPWCRSQVSRLSRLGPDPTVWREADPAHLPSAARTSLTVPTERPGRGAAR